MIATMIAAALAATMAGEEPAKKDGLGEALRAASALNACRNHVKTKLLVPPARTIEVTSIHGDENEKTGVWLVDFDVTLKDAAAHATRYVGQCKVQRDLTTTARVEIKRT